MATPTSVPGTFTIQVSTSLFLLGAGTHIGMIQINVTGQPSQTVPVTLNVLPYTVSTTGMTFNYTIGGMAPLAQTLTISSASSIITPTLAVQSIGSWLAAGAVVPGISVPVQISVPSPGSLGAGTYVGTIQVNVAGQVQTVSVTLNVVASGGGTPTYTVSPLTMTFNHLAGSGAAPASQFLTIGSSSVISPTLTVQPTGSWLQTGSVGAGTSIQVQINVVPGSLGAGVYSGLIQVNVTGQPSQTVAITLNVLPFTVSPSSMTFNYTTGGSTPAVQALAINSTSQITPTLSVQSIGNWLPANPVLGSPPATSFSINVQPQPGSLGAGTYVGSIQVNVPGQASQTVLVTLVVSSGTPAGITVTPAALTFNYQPGCLFPQPLSFTLTTQVMASYTITPTSSGNWLFVGPLSGTASQTATTITVGVSPGSLAPGSYQGTLAVSVFGLGTATVAVTLNVGVAGAACISPLTMAFNHTLGGTPPALQTLTIASTTAAAISYSLLAQSTPAGWLQATPTFGTGITNSVQVSVLPGSLGVGTYNGTIQVNVSGQVSQTVNVTLTVTSGAVISVNPAALTFNYQPPSGPLPENKTFTLTTPTAASFQVTGVTPSWLLLGTLFGTTTGTPATATITVGVNPSSLAVGSYQGAINISVTGIGTATVQVTLNVGVAGAAYTVSPLTPFNHTFGGTPPAAQTLTIASTTSTPISYSLVVQSTPAGWLQATPPSGTGITNSVQVSVLPGSLAVGTYNGTIQVNVSGQASQTVNVTLTVASATGIAISTNTLTFNYQLVSGAFPLNQNVVLNTPFPVNFLVTATTTTPGVNWLVVPPTGNTSGTLAPFSATIPVGVNPGALTAGSYQGTITVNVTGLGTVTVQVTLNITAGAPGALNPNQLSFTFQTGGSNPPVQLVQMSTQGGQQVSFTAAATSTGNWLQVTPQSGSAPGFVAVSVNPANLTPANYSGTVNITLAGASTPIALPVAFSVSATAVLRLSLNNAAFNYQIGGNVPAAQAQPIEVSSTGAPIAFTVTTQVNTPAGGNWLGVSQTSATTPATVQIQVNAGSLSAGSYSGSITFSSSGQPPVVVPVAFTIANTPLLNTDKPSLLFQAAPGSTSSSLQTLAIRSTGIPISVTPAASVYTPAGGNWLTVLPIGSISTEANLQIFVSPAGLPEGTYYGAILMPGTPLGAVANSPVVIPVILTIASNLAVSPASLNTFTQIQGGPAPQAQTLNITSTGAVLSFSAQASTASGTGWLSVNPASGITPGSVQVSVNGAGLSQGTYDGSVTITAQGASNSPQTVAVRLTITAPPTVTVSPTSLTFNANTSGQTPPTQSVSLTTTGVVLSFSALATVTAGAPQWLSVTPTSGNTPVTLTVSVNLTGLQPGTTPYTGAITLNFGLATPVAIPVTLNYVTVPTPVINAVQNSASGLPTAVSPGMIVAIYGANLGPQTLVTARLTPAGTVDTMLETVRVFFDGIASPLAFVRQDVVAAVVSYSIAGRASTKLQVEYQGVRSREVDLRVVDTAPGIFTDNQQGFGQGAIHNPGFSRNSAANPVARGSFATAYLTGEGELNPAGITGFVSTADMLRSPRGIVQVRVGGRPAEVIHAVSIPNVVLGEIQVSFFIPDDAPTGAAVPLEITVGNAASQPGVTMAVR
ncbi:MAG: hypothetical protein HY235_15495 [Acidobacteria bacterium]|nr:hypothetical protein [Acidobacteriota bacterium]